MIRHFKGSRAIGFWSHLMIGLERDQQTDNAGAALTTVRVLKDRFTGQATGHTYYMGYNADTGRMYITDPPSSDGGGSPFDGDDDY
jgi:twinkle protein